MGRTGIKVGPYCLAVLPSRINAADPGMTATDPSGGRGHPVEDGTDAIVAFALGGPDAPTGAYRDRDGDLPR